MPSQEIHRLVDVAQYQTLLKRSVLVPLGLSVVVGLLLLWQVRTFHVAAQWVDQVDEVLAVVNDVEKLAVDAETGMRGYLISRDNRFLEPYKNSLRQVPQQIGRLNSLLSKNPGQLAQVGVISSLWEKKVEWMKCSISLRNSGKFTDDRLISGKTMMDEIRKQFEVFKAEERRLRTIRDRNFRNASETTFAVIVGLVFLLGLILMQNTRGSLRSLSNAYENAISSLEARTHELYESREWFATTLKSIGDAVIVVDPQAQLVFMNPIAENLTGWTLEEAKNRPMTEVFNIINEESRQPAFNPVKRVLREGIVLGLANHTILISKQNVERPIEDSAAPVKDARGKITGVVLVFRDVAGKYESMRQLENLTTALKKAVEYRDDFLSVASHELRTPLTSLNIQLQMAHRKVQPEQSVALSLDAQKRLVDLSLEQVKRLTRLVDDLLDVSRIQAGRLSYELKPLDISELVKAQVERFIPQFKERKSLLEFNSTGHPTVKADRFRLEQVIINLLTNALKYGNGKAVFVKIENHEAKAIVSVKDNGIGIPHDQLSSIFERFERAPGTSNISGLGLGLFIAKQIVQAHKGRIWAESEPGSGSTFFIELPLA